MKTHNLGLPRIGGQRELKKASEKYWAGKLSQEELLSAGRKIRKENWLLQREQGIELIPSNDFSFYDQVLDLSLTLGNIPPRFQPLVDKNLSETDLYFAMARGYQKEDLDITPLEMTKWFDTNYHYIVPEFFKEQTFTLRSLKVIDEFKEAKALGIDSKPVIIGPISYLLLGRAKKSEFSPLNLIDKLLPVYLELLSLLKEAGAKWIQFDEPLLGLDLNSQAKELYPQVYKKIKDNFPQLRVVLATYFEGLQDQMDLALKLPVETLHIDLVRSPEQLLPILEKIPENLALSLGVIDGRNIWKNDFKKSLSQIDQAINKIGNERVWIAPSCSLLHSPYDLALETDEKSLPSNIKNWMSFAKQKLREVSDLKKLALDKNSELSRRLWEENQKAIQERRGSKIIHIEKVKKRVELLSEKDTVRESPFEIRKKIQREHLKLPLLPTTTIGSFPQTGEIRKLRSQYKRGIISKETYENAIEEAELKTIRWQEKVGLDVLVHGEYERNDMVEYFGELLEGYAFTKNGWVQSYGSRYVKPPIIYGDVVRTKELSVRWTTLAQKHTKKLLKGMLTGPVTMLQWAFVRDDQPRKRTCFQIALAIRDEVKALEEAGISVIQIDEPAFREGLPLRKEDQKNYLNWAVKAFKISSSGAKNSTQIHTHMCYSDFNAILDSIAALDADVITIETTRSQMKLLKAFVDFKYPNDIGPGIYDIHSPRIPNVEEMEFLLKKALEVLPAENVWVNPDCGLKTRKWEEIEPALKNMVQAAANIRAELRERN